MNEILAYVERDGQRFIVVWFPPSEYREEGGVEILADDPYWWRTAGNFIDRAVECCDYA